jgi:hypothetical protein
MDPIARFISAFGEIFIHRKQVWNSAPTGFNVVGVPFDQIQSSFSLFVDVYVAGIVDSKWFPGKHFPGSLSSQIGHLSSNEPYDFIGVAGTFVEQWNGELASLSLPLSLSLCLNLSVSRCLFLSVSHSASHPTFTLVTNLSLAAM